jgi:peptidoglycan/LPS O-acetylase OafA/YrhL
MPQQKFAVLDGMRGIAALFILTRHTGNFWGFWLFKSYLAVDLFFILSGFVIAHAYEQKLMHGVITNRQFVLIRLIRLYPVYALSLVLASALAFAVGVGTVEASQLTAWQIGMAIALSLLFLPSCIPGVPTLFPLNDPAWSLFFELAVNFMYAAIRPWLTDKRLLALLALFGLLVCFCSFKNGGLDTGFTWGLRSIVTGAARCCFGFLFGVFLYKHRGRFSNVRGVLTTLIIPIVALAAVLSLPNLHEWNWIADFVGVSVVFPLCVLLASCADKPPFQAGLLALGSASYPIYVMHQPLGHLLSLTFPEVIQKNAPLSGIVLVLVLVPAAVWLEKAFDIPLRKRLTRSVLGGSKT